MRRRRTDGNVTAYFNVPLSDNTGFDANLFTRSGILDQKKFFRQLFIKTPMYLAKSFLPRPPPRESPLINPPLDCNVCLCFHLEISFMSVGAVIVVKRQFDINRMGIMSLDEIAVAGR